MQIGSLAFGLTLSVRIFLNGLSLLTSPILVYKLCVVLTGFFCTKPIAEFESYSTTQSTLHSTSSQIAGVTFSISILTQLFFNTENNFKLIHVTFVILVIGLSAILVLLNNYQGIALRILYLTNFICLIKYYKP